MIESGRINIKRPCNGYYLRWWYNGWHYWWFLPGTMTYDTDGQEYYTLGTQKVSVGSGQINYAQCSAIRTILNTREVDVWTDVGWKSLKIERDSVIVYDNKVDGYEIEFVIVVGSRHISDTGYSPIETMPPVVPPVWVSSCPNGNIVIGTQVWSSCNYDILYPGSQVYGNDEANRALFGGLYTWYQVTASGFCPTGWHIPTVAEWNTMITFVGGAAGAGDKLKAVGTTYWDPVNTATDDYIFGGRGSGYGSGGGFNAMYLTGDFWTADEATPTDGAMFRLWNDEIYITQSAFVKTTYLAVRLVRDTPATVADTGYGALYNWYAAMGYLSSITLTFDLLANASGMIGGDATSLADWNTAFAHPVGATPFTAISVNSNTVTLYNGANIVVPDSLFSTDYDDFGHLISIVDTGCIIEAGFNSFGDYDVDTNRGILETAILPALVIAGESCFYSNPLLLVSLPTLTIMGNSCFILCTSLITINLPSLTTLGSGCFDSSFSLTSISLPALIAVDTSFGGSVLNNGVFSSITGNIITLTVPAYFMTNNGGNPDGDIAYLQANNTVTIIQV